VSDSKILLNQIQGEYDTLRVWIVVKSRASLPVHLNRNSQNHESLSSNMSPRWNGQHDFSTARFLVTLYAVDG